MRQIEPGLLRQLAGVDGAAVLILLLLVVLLREGRLRQILGLSEELLLPQVGEVLPADDGAEILLATHRLLGHEHVLVPALQVDQRPLGLVVLHLESRRLMLLVLLLHVQVLEVEDGGVVVYDRRHRGLLRLQSLLLGHETEFHLLLRRHHHLLLS